MLISCAFVKFSTGLLLNATLSVSGSYLCRPTREMNGSSMNLMMLLMGWVGVHLTSLRRAGAEREGGGEVGAKLKSL